MKRSDVTIMAQEDAELLALQVLDWLAADNARIVAFLAASGTAPGSLRGRARDPAFLLAVIEFLMADEAMLMECCTALDVAPDQPAAARAALPGGAQVHWT